LSDFRLSSFPEKASVLPSPPCPCVAAFDRYGSDLESASAPCPCTTATDRSSAYPIAFLKSTVMSQQFIQMSRFHGTGTQIPSEVGERKRSQVCTIFNTTLRFRTASRLRRGR
jgi:hypothetical protein